jgi:uncharacterized coiled-coil protein SlyX
MCFILHYSLCDRHSRRIKVLESRVTELEIEASRLLRTLETQKSLVAETESTMKRKLAEASKDLLLKVQLFFRQRDPHS